MPVLSVDDHQRGDLPLLEDVEALGGQGLRRHGHPARRHDAPDRRLAEVDPAVEGPAKVPVREDAEQAALGVHDGGHAETLRGHLQQGAARRGVRADPGHGLPGVHEVLHPEQQAAPEPPARMGACEVLRPEVPGFEEGDRDRVSHRERRGGARGGSEPERAGFLRDAHVDVDVRVAREARRGIAGQGDERYPEPLDGGHDGQDLVRLAGVRERDDRILARDHAEVAVARLAGMNEERGGSGARQGRGHLVPHVPGLAHSGHDDPARAREDDLAGAHEVFVDPGQQPAEGVDLRSDDLGSEPEEGALAHAAGRGPGEGWRRVLWGRGPWGRTLLERIGRGRATAAGAGRPGNSVGPVGRADR